MSEELTKVRFTNLNKTLFPQTGIKKKQLLEYYIRIAPKILPFLENRAIVLNRFPNGIQEKGFYEKNAPTGKPPWVKTIKITSKNQKRITNYIICNNLDTLIWIANLSSIEIHIPLSKIDSIENPDFIFFDIDPESPATITQATKVSLILKDKLEKLGFKSYIKTSGKKGLHVLIPIKTNQSFKKSKKFVHQIGVELAKESHTVVAELSETKKPGTTFVDYLQNSLGRTIASPYSLRATPQAFVSTPLYWSEVEKGIKPSQFNIKTVIKRKKTPWKDLLKNKQTF